VFGWALDAVTILQILGSIGGVGALIRYGPRTWRWCVQILDANWELARLQRRYALLERELAEIERKTERVESLAASAAGLPASAAAPPTTSTPIPHSNEPAPSPGLSTGLTTS
jgi:hypothetical protein